MTTCCPRRRSRAEPGASCPYPHLAEGEPCHVSPCQRPRLECSSRHACVWFSSAGVARIWCTSTAAGTLTACDATAPVSSRARRVRRPIRRRCAVARASSGRADLALRSLSLGGQKRVTIHYSQVHSRGPTPSSRSYVTPLHIPAQRQDSAPHPRRRGSDTHRPSGSNPKPT